MNGTTTNLNDIIVYSFKARNPANGYCEFQKLTSFQHMKEPGNFIFCLLSCSFGIIGIIKSGRHISQVFIYMYGLIISYGLMEGIAHATLWNGFSRIGETILKLQQTLVTTLLYSNIDLPNTKSLLPYYTLVFALLIAGTYPMVSVVLSSSFKNEWVGWLTFDGIWLVVLVVGILVWKCRKRQKNESDMFYLIWYMIVCIVLAYICWVLDRFVCNRVIAWMFLHGFWHIFLSLGMYYLITLSSYLKADSCGCIPEGTSWPWSERKLHLLYFVRWKMKPEPTLSGSALTIA